MNAVIKKGVTVRQIMPAPVVGIVAGFSIDDETGERQLRVKTPTLDTDGKQIMYEDRHGDAVQAVDGDGKPMFNEKHEPVYTDEMVNIRKEMVPEYSERFFKENEVELVQDGQ